MKKKRFLKLVMSYGIQRDKAARMAARVGNVFLPSTHEIIAGAQPEEENTAARWWVKTPNPNYSKPQAEERQG